MVNSYLKRFSISAVVLAACVSTSVFAESLEKVVQHTVKTNPNVLAWTKVQKASNETVKQAKSHYYPTVDVYGGFGREKTENVNTAGGSRTLSRTELGTRLRQNLFEGLATYYDVKRTKARTDADSYQVYGASEDVALAVTEAYLNVMRFEKLLNIAQDNLATHQRIYNKVKARGNSGVGREADIYQASGRLALAKSNLVAVQNNYRNARANYFKVTGLNPRGLKMPRKPSNHWMPHTEQHAVAKALKYNPKMRVAVIDVDEAIAQHNISHSTAFPVIDFILEANNNHNVNGARGDNDNYLAFIDVHYNIFRGGHDVARQRETAFQAQEAAEIRNRTCREVIELMRLAWNNRLAAEKRLPTLKTHKQDSVKTADAYSDQFKLGKRTLLDLLDSENERFSSAAEYVNGTFDTYIARYQILAAYGCLNHFLGVNLPPSAKDVYDVYNPNANPTVVPRHSEAERKTKFVRSDSLHSEPPIVMSHAQKPAASSSPRKVLAKTEFTQPKGVNHTKVAHAEKPKTPSMPPKIKSFNSTTKWTVRVGSYTKESEVDKIVSSIKDYGMNGFIKEHSDHHGKTTYEVFVGPTNSRNDATQLARQLKNIKLSGTIVRAS